MLALTRGLKESVVIGDPENPIGVVRIMSVRGDKVRLAFEGFDRDIEINRQEVADRLVEELRDRRAKLRKLTTIQAKCCLLAAFSLQDQEEHG